MQKPCPNLYRQLLVASLPNKTPDPDGALQRQAPAGDAVTPLFEELMRRCEIAERRVRIGLDGLGRIAADNGSQDSYRRLAAETLQAMSDSTSGRRGQGASVPNGKVAALYEEEVPYDMLTEW